MSDSRPLVIVLSRNYSTGLGIIRSLGLAGYKVDLIASTKKKGSSIIASSSKFVNNSVEVLSPNIQGDSGDGLIEVLKGYVREHNQKIVLFPADDFTASVVANNRHVLEEDFLMPGTTDNSSYSLVELMDKQVQSSIARSVGITTPQEWIVSLKGDIAIPSDMVYPCFVKSIHSISGSKSEMGKCDTAEELRRHLRQMKDFYSDRSVLIQEYLDIDKEYDLSGVCIDDEIIIPAFIEKTGIAQHERGVTLSGRMIPVEELGTLKNKIAEMLRAFHYVGMFDMEFNLCGGRLYFNEVNLRSGGPNFAYYLNGVNLPEIFVKELTGEGHEPEEEIMPEFGRSFVYEKVAWEDYIYSYIDKAQLKRCIDDADYTLLATDLDPEPGRVFNRRIRLSAMKHFLKGMASGGQKKEIQMEAVTGKKTAIVTGRNYGNILTMCRDLGRAGYDVHILRVFKKKPSRINFLRRMKPESYSKYAASYRECIADKDEKIMDCLNRKYIADGKMLLIPVDDYLCCITDNYSDKLKDKYIMPAISDKAGEITRLMDKNLQKKLAAEHNLPLLASWLIESSDGRFDIPPEVHYPCFIKPNVSMKSTKGKMKKCDSREELLKVLTDYAGSEDFQMLVEEFAEIKTEYSILGVSTPDGIAAPGLLKVLKSGHRERKGVALTGELISTEHMQPLIDSCNAFIKSLNYVGLFDVDLIETIDGKVYFVELNFRAGASSNALTQMGVNLPGIFADSMLQGIPLKDSYTILETGKKFISEKVLQEEYARSDVNRREIRQYMQDADIFFIRDEEDMKPYRNFKKYYKVAGLMRIPYRIRDRK